MSENRENFDPLDLLARAAATQTSASSRSDKLDAQVTRALLVANSNRNAAERRRVVVAYAAAAAVLVAFFARDYFRATPSPAAPGQSTIAAPTRLTLATGDALTTSSGATFDMRGFSDSERRVHVSSGTVLFDVVHLPTETPFVVETDDARVMVRGTVFTVGYAEGVTRVHVFEGHVDVIRADGTHALHAGQQISSRPDGDRTAWAPELQREGELAARQRALAARAPANATVQTPSAPSAALPPASAITTPSRVAIGAAQDALSRGDYRTAFDASEQGHANDGAWLLLRADALRGLNRIAEAARTYDLAADHLSPSRATVAGFSAARLYLDRLGNPTAALQSLTRSRADESGSTVEEPAFVIRLKALDALHQQDELSRRASIYLARFPDGSAREWVSQQLSASR